jgi:H+/Cl- antiporter ClcA
MLNDILQRRGMRGQVMSTIMMIMVIQFLFMNNLSFVSSFTIPNNSVSISHTSTSISSRTSSSKTSSSDIVTNQIQFPLYSSRSSRLYNTKKPSEEDDNKETSNKFNADVEIDADKSTNIDMNDNDNSNNNNNVSTDIVTNTSNNKEKVWNTSIFPTKITMSPPVEKNKFIPQLYIQTLAAIIGILSGVSVAVFKLSIDAIRQFCYGSTSTIVSSSMSSSGLIPFIPIFLIPVIGSIGVALLSLTGEFSPGLRGVVKEVDDDSLALGDSSNININGKVNGNVNGDTSDKRGKRDVLQPIRKSLAAILTLGTGNSLGPEGPGVEIGTAVSRFGMMLWPPDLLKSSGSKTNVNGNSNENDDDNGRISRNRLLLACGAAAGVSSGFNAPLSGVFFALEVVQASLQPVNVPSPLPVEEDMNGISTSISSESMNSNIQLQQQALTSIQGSISAILIASVLAALTARVFLGNELALMLVTYEIKTPLIELPLYTLLGISCGLISVVFSQAAKFFKKLFEGAIGPKPVRKVFNALPAPALPIIGGLTCGFVGFFYPQILFFGYDTLNKLLEDNTLPTGLLLTLLAAKTFTTAVCAGSGLVGGTLAPSLFLGGMVGASFHNIACGSFAALQIPESILSSSGLVFDLAGVPAYSMVGAASVLAAIFRAPLTASLLLFEITRNYDVLLPLLASAGVASLVSDILESKIEQAK